jgi:hypothetical protein
MVPVMVRFESGPECIFRTSPAASITRSVAADAAKPQNRLIAIATEVAILDL